MGGFPGKMLPRHVLRAARGCVAVSQIFQVKSKNLGKNKNFDTPTTFMGRQFIKLWLIQNLSRKNYFRVRRALEGLPLDGPLQNHLQKIFMSKIYLKKNFWPKILVYWRSNRARKWSGFWPFLTPCAQTWPARGPHPWSSEVPSGYYQITPEPHWSGFQ